MRADIARQLPELGAQLLRLAPDESASRGSAGQSGRGGARRGGRRRGADRRLRIAFGGSRRDRDAGAARILARIAFRGRGSGRPIDQAIAVGATGKRERCGERKKCEPRTWHA